MLYTSCVPPFLFPSLLMTRPRPPASLPSNAAVPAPPPAARHLPALVQRLSRGGGGEVGTSLVDIGHLWLPEILSSSLKTDQPRIKWDCSIKIFPRKTIAHTRQGWLNRNSEYQQSKYLVLEFLVPHPVQGQPAQHRHDSLCVFMCVCVCPGTTAKASLDLSGGRPTWPTDAVLLLRTWNRSMEVMSSPAVA